MKSLSLHDSELKIIEPAETKERDTDMFETLFAWGKSRVIEAKRNFAKNRFETQIADVIKVANAHRAKGISKGDAIYLELWLQAKKLVEEFCEIWGGNASSVLTEQPALRELYSWAYYNPDEENIKRFRLVILSVLATSIGIGVISSIVVIVYHMFTFWIH